MSTIVFRQFSEITEEFVELTDALDQELWAVQGEVQKVYHGFNRLEGISDVVIAFLDDRAVGCASFKRRDALTAEVKRVFVRPEVRGRGVSKALMAEIESRARGSGVRTLLVETSRSFAAATSLYRGLGYAVTENFPPYLGLAESICFRKEFLP